MIRGILRFGVLSAAAAMRGVRMRVANPWTLSKADVMLWVWLGTMCRRTSSIYGKIGTTNPYRRVSVEGSVI
jgi:hypothetical protein